MLTFWEAAHSRIPQKVWAYYDLLDRPRRVWEVWNIVVDVVVVVVVDNTVVAGIVGTMARDVLVLTEVEAVGMVEKSMGSNGQC